MATGSNPPDQNDASGAEKPSAPEASNPTGADLAGVLSLADIERARTVVTPTIKHTPIVASLVLSERLGSPVALKAENLQTTGSFKLRGALNKLASLGPAAAAGVTTGSAGNHAQAVAYAAQQHGVPCEIFVPRGAPVAKIQGAQAYGATVIEEGDSLSEALLASQARAAASEIVFCHPFDDPVVIAGQGTLGLEVLDQVDDVSTLVVPLGGGGLIGGAAAALKAVRPETRVVGVQAEACAPWLGDPVPSGPVVTLADGIAVKSPGSWTRPLVEAYVDEIVVVDEDTIADAMVLAMDRAKLYVEGAGAVGIAAVLAGLIPPSVDGTTVVVLSGGNVDLGVVPGLIRRHENAAQRRLTVFARIDDRPGGLVRFLQLFSDAGANLIEVEHIREGVDLHVRETGVRATFEIRGPDHRTRLLDLAKHRGYEVLADTI